MAQFSLNPHRIDPFKGFRFRVRIGVDAVAGVSKVSGLKRTTEVIPHRDGGQPNTVMQSPGQSKFEPITLERGITFDREFEAWAYQVYSPEGDGGISLRNFRKDIKIELCNLNGVAVLAWNVFRCWPSEYTPLPELDANGNAVAFETLVLQNEGFERDDAVREKKET